MAVVAIVIVVIIAVAGIYYVAVYNKPAAFASEIIKIDIGGAILNGSTPFPAEYSPANFSVAQGQHVILNVVNDDYRTHGLAVPSFNVDTGTIQPNATATISFAVSTTGNYTFNEPAADCGGGACNAGNETLTGWFVVIKP